MKMKKILFGLILTISIFMAIISCSKCDNNNDDNTGDSSSKNRIALTSSVDTELLRSSLQNTQIVRGQKVGVIITPNNNINSYLYNNQELIAGGDGTFEYKSMMYYPLNGNNIDVFAYHPYIESYSITSSNTINFKVFSDQTNEINYLNSDVLYAQSLNIVRSNNPIPLTFSHKLSKIVYTIQKGDDSDIAELSSIVLQNVLSESELNIEDGCLITNLDGTRVDLSAFAVKGGNPGVSQLSGAAMILPPQTFPIGTELLKINIGTMTYAYTTASELTLESGKRYNFIITVNMSGLTLESTIEDWIEGNSIEGEGIIN